MDERQHAIEEHRGDLVSFAGVISGVLLGAGAGAGLMYFLDPDKGRRRRAILRDKTGHALHETRDAINITGRDIGHRMQGIMAELKAVVIDRKQVPDDILAARVRSRIGRAVSHPHAVRIQVNQGKVSLTGPILSKETEDLLKTVSSVRGVGSIENKLEVHERPDKISSLQGGVRRPGYRFELLQTNWTPAARALTGTLGCALAVTVLRSGKRKLGSIFVSTVGFALCVRSVTNMPLKRIFGIGRKQLIVRREPLPKAEMVVSA